MEFFRAFLKIGIVAVIIGIIGIIIINKWVSASTENQLYNDVNAIPHNKVGLVLGTSKHLGGGYINYYYKYRIDAAVALFKAGKIDFILVSGDNRTKSYDETTTMQDDLIAAGIPKEKIFMDYAGFRTLDSILRCKNVFGEENITIISQPFHNQRAVFIANHKGLNAVAFNAADVSKNAGFKTQLREKFARVKMLLDLAFNKQAKFYGDKIVIG
jgi:SanA protein